MLVFDDILDNLPVTVCFTENNLLVFNDIIL